MYKLTLKSILHLTAILVILLLCYCNSSDKDNKKDKSESPEKPTKPTLKVGVEVGIEVPYPIQFQDQDSKNIIGFDIDLVKDFSLDAGYDIQFVNLDESKLLEELQKNNIDFIFSAMLRETFQKANIKDIVFTEAYFKLPYGMLMNKKDLENYKGLAMYNSEKSTIAIPKFFKEGNSILSKIIPKAKIINSYNDAPIVEIDESILNAIKKGKINAFIFESAIIKDMMKDNPELFTNFSLFPRISEIPSKEIVGATLSKNSAIVEKFNAFLIKYKNDGKYNELINKHITDKESPLLSGNRTPLIN